MNGAHDLGGMMGFGAVAAETDEPVFHDEWERRIFALVMGTAGDWVLDEDRAACEAMHPAAYVNTSYYEHWLHGFTTLVMNHGLASAAEIADGKVRLPRTPVVAPIRADDVWTAVTKPGSYARTIAEPARFKPGDMIRTRSINPVGHTRLPRYARNRTGTIDRVHGAHVFPDANAAGKGEDPHWLYSVKFAARELWGEDRPAGDCIYIDLWEPYLEPA